VRRIDRLHVPNTADRFRFGTLQSRFQTFLDLWERGLRAREEGRPGPFAQRPATAAAREKGPQDRILHVAAFHDPTREMDKLHELYERLADARREAGEDAVPFHKFADLVKDQVKRLKQSGSPEVAFRVAVKDGKVNFTALDEAVTLGVVEPLDLACNALRSLPTCSSATGQLSGQPPTSYQPQNRIPAGAKKRTASRGPLRCQSPLGHPAKHHGRPRVILSTYLYVYLTVIRGWLG
jgi:hypothetical protein